MVTVAARSLAVTRAGRSALDGVTFDLAAGTVVAVIGPNGAGKSTLLGTIAGRLRPSTGSITVHGTVADVPQTTTVDAEVCLPVLDVVRMGRYPHRGLLRRFRPADHAAVGAAIEAMGLVGLERRTLDSLSGGQRQRTLVAQGLAQQADIVLLDEPGAALDGPSRGLLLDAVRAEAERGRTVLLATHAMDEALHADLVLVLAGRLVAMGPPADVLDRSEVAALFSTAPLRSAVPAPTR